MAKADITKSADLARTQDIDFALQFGESVKNFLELMGIMKPEVLSAGTQVKQYKITGASLAAQAAEGDEIPLTKYTQSVVGTYSVELKNYRKATTTQAILKSGYQTAVEKTDKALSRDIRAAKRAEFFEFLKKGTSTAKGKGLQAAIAAGTGKLINELSENNDESEQMLYFLNPTDVYEYLGTANVVNQGTEFGMRYLEGFLGMGRVFLDSKVPAKTAYITPQENIHAYSADLAALKQAGFDYYTDESNIIGVAHTPMYANATAETYASCGLLLIPEVTNYIVKVTIEASA